MRRVNKTIYVLNDGYYIHCQNDALVFELKDEEKVRIPAIGIEQIVIFGNTTISTYLMGYCCKKNILLSYISTYGNYYGSFCGEKNGNVLLRQKQYLMKDTKREIDFVKNIVLGKAINSRYTILRSKKNASVENNKVLEKISNQILDMINKIPNQDNVNSVRGIEGKIADLYFSVFDNMLKTKEESMCFIRRSKRPPENNCNAALSLLYTLLMSNCVSAIETAGIDAEFGYLHSLRSGRHSLACDLAEEFRSCIVDRFLISEINLKKITSKDFVEDEGGIRFKDKSVSKFLNRWEEYKKTEIVHPLYKKKMEIKVVPYVQAQLIAEYIRGDIEEYPPIEWR